MTPDEEILYLVTTADRLARRMNAVFVPDPKKIADFKIAIMNGRRRRALQKAQTRCG